MNRSIILKKKKKRSLRQTWIFVLSALVVFITTYMLILPAISIDEKEAADQGGIELINEEIAPENAEETAPAEVVPGEMAPEEMVLEETGDDYSIELKYDADADLPEGAFLQVEEIAEDTEEYESYVRRSADVADLDNNRIEMARVFDISIIDPETGDHCQPADSVNVSIDLMQDLEIDDENMSVVHFGDGAELLESEVSEDVVEFEAVSFSVYVVAKAGPPLTGEHPAGDSSDDISGREFYISAKTPNANHSEYYLMAETVTDGNLTMIRRTAANDITDAAAYRFEPVEGESGKYYLCSNGQYIRRTGGSSLGLTTDNTQATKYTVTQNGGYFYILGENGYYLNLKSKDAGVGFQASTATDSEMILTIAPVEIGDDPYGLNGRSFGIVYANGSTGSAMTASFGGDRVTVRTEGDTNTIKVTKDSGDITLWTFESAGGGKYHIKTSDGQYIKLTAGGLTLVGDASDATTLSVTPGTTGDTYEGRYRITVIDRGNKGTTAIRYVGNSFKADTTNSYVQNGMNEWFYLAMPETVPVTLKKVSVDNTDPGQTEEPLAGAGFTVFTSEEGSEIARDSGGVPLTDLSSGDDGVFYSGYMDPGTYYLEETEVPAGYYAPQGRIRLEISANNDPVITATWTTGEADQTQGTVTGNAASGYTISIRNMTGVELPSTGGPGTIWIYLIGTILLLGCGITLIARRRIRA